MKQWQVSAKKLTKLFRTMKTFAQGTAGEACWTVSDGQLTIQWAGMDFGLPVDGEEEVILKIRSSDMAGLVRIPLQRSGAIPLSVKEGRLYFGSFSMPCEERSAPVRQLLPVGAGPGDIALLPFSHTAREIADADLSGEVQAVEERKQRSIEEAAQALAWLGVESRHLVRWIDAHLEAIAQGGATFSMAPKTVVIDDKGQMALFGGD